MQRLRLQGIKLGSVHFLQLTVHHPQAMVATQQRLVAIKEIPVQGIEGAGAFAQNSGTAGSSTSGTSGHELTTAEQMMGKAVLGSDNQKIGSVEDVIIDPQSGQAKQLVVSSGGFLGIGDRQVAIDFKDAQFDQNSGDVKVPSLTQQAVRDMPEFQYGSGIVSLSRRGTSGGSGGSTDDGAANPGVDGSGSGNR